MKFINILPVAALTLLIASCSDKKEVEPAPAAGKDVVFSASAPQSRTEYQSPNPDGSYPIWWLPNDQMLVMSPQCAIKYGQYQVGTTVPSTGAASAGTLQKIGAAGVQWGENATADFYSVYPYSKVEENGIKPDTKTITMRMPHIQNDYIRNNGDGTYTAKADMDGSFLYAQTNGVKNGEDVNLGYKSLSTAIRFTLVGPAAANAESATIQYIKITAANNTKIAGRMDAEFGDDASIMPSVHFDATDSYDHVYIYSSYEGSEGGGYLVLNKDQKIELNAFVMPEEDCNIENWTIEVQTLTKKYSKTLGKGNLARGMIHNLGELPALDADNESEWKVENWMVNIPRNTYICEISLPGSWNSMNSDFQQGTVPTGITATSLTDQYKAGARAFHLDTRWKNTTTLGIAAGSSSDSRGSGWSTSGKVTNGSSFVDALTTITTNLQKDEYMVVICTFAQGSAIPEGKTWEQAVSDACAQNANIYDGSTITRTTTVGDVLGKVIVICNSEGTTPTNLSGSKCLFVNAPLTLEKGIFSANPPYKDDVIYLGSGTASAIKMIVSQCQTEFKSFQSGISNYNSQEPGDGVTGSNNRGYFPNNTERLNQLNAVLKWSQDNYNGGGASNGADKLIYLGIGGITGGYSSLLKRYGTENNPEYLAQEYGPWIYNKIQDMVNETTNYYPVGIVLMNNVVSTQRIGTSGTTTLTGPEVMKQILLLNNRYQKAFDKNKPAWPTTGGEDENNPANYSMTNTNGGNAWNITKQ